VCVCVCLGDADPAAGTRLSFVVVFWEGVPVPVHDGHASKRWCDGISEVAYQIPTAQHNCALSYSRRAEPELRERIVICVHYVRRGMMMSMLSGGRACYLVADDFFLGGWGF
jgi:hypothetical protein